MTSPTRHVCAEIQYETPEGNVHSDVCGDPANAQWREFLHANLDEWLNRADGSGFFIVGSVAYREDFETEILERFEAIKAANLNPLPLR